MKKSTSISKIALDKNGIRLGKIIRIDDLMGKTIKKYKPYAMISVKKRFSRKGLVIPIDLEKVIEELNEQVLFDISKEEFDAELKRLKIIRREREAYPGFVSTAWLTGAKSSDLRPKPRRKKKS